MNLKEIKDAARQAFRDQETHITVTDSVSFIAGFLEGARHRQDEIEALQNEVCRLLSKADEMRDR